jgi:hypothetical protein
MKMGIYFPVNIASFSGPSSSSVAQWEIEKEKRENQTGKNVKPDLLCVYNYFTCIFFFTTATNVALRKSANQSSTARGGSALNAIDGDRSTFHDVGGTGGRCAETAKEASPWWMGDLMRPTAVNAVRVTTRTCCGT